MKYKILIILLLFFITPSFSFAVMRADFPDSESLQPMPTDTMPNISGNINSTSDNVLLPPDDVVQNENAPLSAQDEVAPEAKKKGVWGIFIGIFGLIVVIIVGITIWFLRNRNGIIS